MGKDMEFDCNPNDTSLYHRCSNERVQNSPRCASDTPVFIVAIEKCVSQDQLSKLGKIYGRVMIPKQLIRNGFKLPKETPKETLHFIR